MTAHSRNQKEERLENICFEAEGGKEKFKGKCIRSKVVCHSILEGVSLY
jgi:hypothetical protein